jgi:hypothetical protein
VTEVHRQSDTSARLKTVGTIDPAKKRVVWDDPKKTEQQPFPTDRARWSGHTIECGAHKTEEWLGCRFDGSPLAPARYAQIAFVELQGAGELERLVDPLFFAAPADSKSGIARARKDGYVARGWGFARRNAQDPADPRENFPATDTPFEPWYQAYVPPIAVEGAAARAALPAARGRARSRGAKAGGAKAGRVKKTRAKTSRAKSSRAKTSRARAGRTTRSGFTGEGRSSRPRKGRARKAG